MLDSIHSIQLLAVACKHHWQHDWTVVHARNTSVGRSVAVCTVAERMWRQSQTPFLLTLLHTTPIHSCLLFFHTAAHVLTVPCVQCPATIYRHDGRPVAVHLFKKTRTINGGNVPLLTLKHNCFNDHFPKSAWCHQICPSNHVTLPMSVWWKYNWVFSWISIFITSSDFTWHNMWKHKR